MTLTPESVQEFITTYRDEYDVELPYADAELMGSELLAFYQLIPPLHPNS